METEVGKARKRVPNFILLNSQITLFGTPVLIGCALLLINLFAIGFLFLWSVPVVFSTYLFFRYTAKLEKEGSEDVFSTINYKSINRAVIEDDTNVLVRTVNLKGGDED